MLAPPGRSPRGPVGVPVGTTIGRLAQAFAGNLGVQPVAVTAAQDILGVALGTFLVANVLAVLSALVASQPSPATPLRAE